MVGISTRPALVSGQELGNRLADPTHWRRNFLIPFPSFKRLDDVAMLHGKITAVDEASSAVTVERADGTEVVPTQIAAEAYAAAVALGLES